MTSETFRGRKRRNTRVFRHRRKHGIWPTMVNLTTARVDRLVAQSYLDPAKRHDPQARTTAIDSFLFDYL
jgi:hypothetical protein